MEKKSCKKHFNPSTSTILTNLLPNQVLSIGGAQFLDHTRIYTPTQQPALCSHNLSLNFHLILIDEPRLPSPFPRPPPTASRPLTSVFSPPSPGPHLSPTIVHLHESRRVSGQIPQAGGETRMGQGPVPGGQSRRVSGQPSNRGAGCPNGRGKVLGGQQPSAFRISKSEFSAPL